MPGSLGWGSAVLAAMTTLAPSRRGAQRDRQADAAAGAGDEEGLAGQIGHGVGHGTLPSRSIVIELLAGEDRLSIIGR